MNSLRMICCISALAATAAHAQTWEIGGVAGYSLFRNVTASSPAGTATAGFHRGAAFSAIASQNVGKHIGGEFRYTYAFADPYVSDGGQSARLDGQSHAFEYDFLAYAQPRDSAVRVFLAAGAGARLFRGTGNEMPFQPLAGIAVPTHTQEFVPLVSFGGGAKIRSGKHTLFRIDVRDAASPFPKSVIAPTPPGGKITGWLHNLVVMFGISMTL